MEMRSSVKRVSVMIGEEQYERITKEGLNLSALVRDLLEDHFSEDVVTIHVSAKTAELYNKIVSNTGATDKDIEPLFVEVLKKLLATRLEKIKQLQDSLK